MSKILEIISSPQNINVNSIDPTNGPEPKELNDAIQKIRKERLDDPAKEFQRLKQEGFLTAEEEKELCNLFSPSSPRKALYAQAIAIKKAAGKTHYVFIHAQDSNWAIFPYLMKEIAKRKMPETDLHRFKFARTPDLSEKKETDSIETYKNSKSIHDHDRKTRGDLISTDAYFYNTQGGESAHFFLTSNWNVSQGVQDAILQAILKLYPTVSKQFAEKVSYKATRTSEKMKRPRCGNLFVFCIPKETSDKVQYRAHPYGRACQCHPQQKDRKILEKLQEGKLDHKSRCTEGWDKIPQFRLFAPELTPGEGKQIYLLSSLPRSERRDIKSKAITLVDWLETASDKTALA